MVTILSTRLSVEHYRTHICLQKDDLRSTLTEDLWGKRKAMTQEEFKAVLGNYRDQQDELSKMRAAEKDKHKAAMLAKMAGAKRGGQYDSKVSKLETSVINKHFQDIY